MMSATECNGCGACCHPFTMSLSPAELWGPMGQHVAEGAWMRAHLTPIPRREGRALQPWSDGFDEQLDENGAYTLRAGFYYRCDRYDERTRRCLDYEHRPDICRRYPWADGVPRSDAKLPPTCSYRADIGLPVEDVPVTIGEREDDSTDDRQR